MKKATKLSCPALFMYSVMALTALLCTVCFWLYYSHTVKTAFVLWIGIVSFMILYHFGLRILFGEITKRVTFDYRHPWFQKRPFEAGLYRFLHVRLWKDRVLTFDPAAYDFQNRTLDELATTMAKSETDHWINEAISLFSLLFALIWGCFPAFLISALCAMLFDAQFIVVQRYNRPIVVRLIEHRKREQNAKVPS